MDITTLFKATIKTVRLRQKKQGAAIKPTDILHHGSKHTKSEFSTKAKDIVSNIKKLQDFLLEHRKAYINAGSLLVTEDSTMSDEERDKLDADAQVFMKACSETIKNFKTEVNEQQVSEQVNQHYDAVLSMIQDYLKSICRIYSEQRAIRVKRMVDRKRISRLEPSRKQKNAKKSRTNSDSDENIPREGATKSDKEKTSKPPELNHTQPIYMDEDDELSPEEINSFEQENKQIFQNMNSMIDEVKQVEGKVVEISRLQEIFAENVLEQESDISRIADVVVGTTENVKEGNEEIREAMKSNAGFRVWILFFLVVLSFTLLFLDWYND